MSGVSNREKKDFPRKTIRKANQHYREGERKGLKERHTTKKEQNEDEEQEEVKKLYWLTFQN